MTPDFELGEYNRQNLVYEKEHLLISGPVNFPDYNYYRVTGMATKDKPKGHTKMSLHRLIYGVYCHDNRSNDRVLFISDCRYFG